MLPAASAAAAVGCERSAWVAGPLSPRQFPPPPATVMITCPRAIAAAKRTPVKRVRVIGYLLDDQVLGHGQHAADCAVIDLAAFGKRRVERREIRGSNGDRARSGRKA